MPRSLLTRDPRQDRQTPPQAKLRFSVEPQSSRVPMTDGKLRPGTHTPYRKKAIPISSKHEAGGEIISPPAVGESQLTVVLRTATCFGCHRVENPRRTHV